jgi:hypothetical protein
MIALILKMTHKLSTNGQDLTTPILLILSAALNVQAAFEIQL